MGLENIHRDLSIFCLAISKTKVLKLSQKVHLHNIKNNQAISLELGD